MKSTSLRPCRVVIIGGGIVGLATAWRLYQRHPDCQVTLLEKEAELAQHQTGHNSGVLHSGIYYQPGSHKAENCRLGKLAMQDFCTEHEVPFEICGKVIVAVTKEELPALDKIFARGQANQVVCEQIGPERLRELEPHVAGIRAIHVPSTGIINYRDVCVKLAQQIRSFGGTILTSTRALRVEKRSDGVVVESTHGTHSADFLVNCAGLQSDRIAKITGASPSAKIIPFRGEYFQLIPQAFHLCRNLIYPVPDPHFPFLGVHFTRMIDGTVECGPNAVLAFAREGYTKTKIVPRDLFESLTYPGFLKLAARYWRIGAGEMWRSWSKKAFVKALQRLVPDVRAELLVPAPAGVRAQAVGADGSMVDDFMILQDRRVINVCNAPSPAATSSLQIGESIVDRIAQSEF